MKLHHMLFTDDRRNAVHRLYNRARLERVGGDLKENTVTLCGADESTIEIVNLGDMIALQCPIVVDGRVTNFNIRLQPKTILRLFVASITKQQVEAQL